MTGVRFLFLLLFFFAARGVFPISFDSSTPEEIVVAMSDEEALGQILIFGYTGTKPGAEFQKFIAAGVGNIKVFGWNSSNLEALRNGLAEMQWIATQGRFSIPLLIATDQEGGWVRHVRGRASETTGNLSLGASRIPYDSWMTGYLIGKELSSLGINMNFAPNVDLFLNSDSRIVDTRAFSSDPVLSGVLAVSYWNGLKAAGVIGAAKHFPGHGAAAEDSHGELPKIDVSLETLEERELVPYRMLIKEELPAVMTGHLNFPKITDANLPATHSPYLLKEVLRKKMGFKGVVVTDDLYMRGARPGGGTVESSAMKAFQAGCDLLLISRKISIQKKCWSLFLKKMEESEEFNADVRQSAQKVLELKKKYLSAILIGEEDVPLKDAIPFPDAEDFLFTQSHRSATMVRGKITPLSTEASPLIISPYQDFLHEGKKQFPKAQTLLIPLFPDVAKRRAVVRSVFRSRTDRSVVFHLINETGALLLNTICKKTENVIAVSSFSPGFVEEAPDAKTVLAIYGTSRLGFETAFAAICGEFLPQGRLPFRLKAKGVP